jgi:ADP-ribose pyrophosphatase
MRYHVGVAIMLQKEGKVLLVQETSKSDCEDKWCYPVGHTELGENTFAAATREAKEETGYDVELKNIIGLLNFSQDEDFRSIIVFTADIIGGDSQERDTTEIQATDWFTFTEVENLAAQGQLRFSHSTLAIIDRLASGKTYDNDLIIDMNEGRKEKK